VLAGPDHHRAVRGRRAVSPQYVSPPLTERKKGKK
jgi:hypothetical protein